MLDTVLLLVLWGLLVVPALVQVCRVWRQPKRAGSPITLLTLGFFFLYVVAYFALPDESKETLLAPKGYLIVLTLAVCSLSMFWLGHRVQAGTQCARARLGGRRSLTFAVALVIVALSGWLVFLSRSGGFWVYYGSTHGLAGAWAETSAYVYELRLFAFPAVFMLLALHLERGLSRPMKVLLGFLGLFLVADAWWEGSRGDWLRLLLILVASLLLLNHRTRISRKVIAISAAVVLTIVVVSPHLREATALGSSRSVVQAVGVALLEQSPLAGSSESRGNELIVAAAVANSAAERGAIDYGYQWLYPLVGFVPRFWWDDKPYEAEWSVDYRELVRESEGWDIAVGAAPTGLADAFIRFSWASPLVWLVLGMWGGGLWRRAVTRGHPVTAGYLCAFNIGLAYMITQSFSAAFYGWFYFAAPIFVWDRIASHRQGAEESRYASEVFGVV